MILRMILRSVMKVLSMRNHVAISAIIAFITIAIMIVIYPKQSYTPQIIVLPLQKNFVNRPQTSSDSVGLYRYLSAGATKIAAINIEQYAAEQNDQDQNDIIQLARSEAAKLGANGLMLKLAGFKQTSGAEAGLRGYVMQFIAAKVGPNDIPMFNQISEPSLQLPNNK